MNGNRAFSASLDKQFKVYDLPSKLCVKTIQTQSPIIKAVVDHSESNMYAACDNQNIYCFGLEISATQALEAGAKSRQKKTLIHKKKVTALCLSVDGQHLVSGDQSGLIYLWSIKQLHEHDDAQSGLISTYELHKDKGMITNLIPIHRPLSLFGLTANMNSFEVPTIYPLQKFKGTSKDIAEV